MIAAMSVSSKRSMPPEFRLTLLGTGDSAQVPVYGCGCAACARARKDPAYRRGPSSALLEAGGRRWLIDAGLPDLAERFPAGTLDGILMTHYHPDHAQGLLPLRWGCGPALPVWGPGDPQGFADLYKHAGPLDFSHPFAPFERRPLGEGPADELFATAIPLNHSRPTFGYLIEGGERRLAYLTDTMGLPEASEAMLRQTRLDVLILDCTFAPQSQPPRNHNDLTRALQTAAELGAAKTVLTHIGHALDAWWLNSANQSKTAASAVAGRDGMVIDL